VAKSVRTWQNWPASMGSFDGTWIVIFQQLGEYRTCRTTVASPFQITCIAVGL